MSCGKALNVEVIGKGKVLEVAFENAYNNAKKEGRKICVGGSCGVPGQSCGYDIESVNVTSIDKITTDAGASGYKVEMEARGKCICGSW